MPAASRSAQGAPLGRVPRFVEEALDLGKQGRPLLAVTTRVATPSAARRLGEARLSRWLKAKEVRKADDLARRIIIAAAKGQQREELWRPRKRRPL